MYYVKIKASLILIIASETTLPELIASFYFLYDIKDKNKKAEELFPIVTENLAEQLEKYVLYAIYQEIIETLLADTKDIKFLNSIKNKIPKRLFLNLLKFSGNIAYKNIPLKDKKLTLKKTTKTRSVRQLILYSLLKSNPKIIKSINKAKSNRNNDFFFGKGWIKISKLYEDLTNRKNTVKTIDAIIDVQHNTGNLFSKFSKLILPINTIIDIKATNDLNKLFHFLPKGKIQQLGKKYFKITLLNNNKNKSKILDFNGRDSYEEQGIFMTYIWIQGKYIVILGEKFTAKKGINKLIKKGYKLNNSDIIPIETFYKEKLLKEYSKKYHAKPIMLDKFLQLNNR